MKNQIIVCFTLVISSFVYSQHLHVNNKNVIYRGGDNLICISFNKADSSTISLITSQGSLLKAGNGWNCRAGYGWIYRTGAGKTTIFTLTGRTPTGKTLSKTFIYRIKNLPLAQGRIRGADITILPISSIPNQIVHADIPNLGCRASFTVTEFKIKVPNKEEVTIEGNSLKSAKELFTDDLKEGDSIHIYDIKAVSNTGLEQSGISPVIIKVQG